MITVIDETSNDTAAGEAHATSLSSTPSPSKESPRDDGNGVIRKDTLATMTSDHALAAPQGLSSVFTATSRQKPPVMDARKAMEHPPNNSDLMSRLRNFLPQMKSANQELLSASVVAQPVGSDPVRLDENLKLEEESDSDSDSDDEDEKHSKTNPLIREIGANDGETQESDAKIDSASLSDSKKTPKNNNSAPTIQLEFTLGNMSGNPLMKLLANDDESDGSGSSAGGDTDDPPVAARESLVVNLLKESKNPPCGSTEEKNNIVVFENTTSGIDGNASNKNTGKKRLITEL